MKILTHFKYKNPGKETENYIEEKISKLSRFNKNLMEAHIDIHQGKEQTAPDKYHVFVNLHLPPQNHVLRASARGRTPQEAVDLVYEELGRQIEKHSHDKKLTRKERLQRKQFKQI